MTEVRRFPDASGTRLVSEMMYRPGDDGSLVVAITEAVADVTGVDPVDLDERLYDRVDPEALVQLVDCRKNSPSPTQVSFGFCSCTVTVDSRDRIAVYSEDPVPGR